MWPMERNALYPHITDAIAAAHPHLVQWSDRLGWLPVVAGGATETDTDDDTGETAGDGDEQDQDGKGDATSGDDGDGEKTLTQAEVDEIVKKRLGRERKAWEKEQAEAAEREKMTEAERLKAEKAEAEQAAQARTDAANQRVIRAEAKAAALAAKVKPDRAKAFLKIVDLDEIEVDDDGEPDSAAIKEAVKAALELMPEFRGTATGASGTEHGDAPKNKPATLGQAIEQHYAKT